MCGIAGFLGKAGNTLSRGAAEAIGRSIEHRGPDDLGFLGITTDGRLSAGRDAAFAEDAEIVLIHRRLSIIDLSDAGWQPMSDQSNRYHLVFNGEIYNHIELREDLEREGVSFRSHCDTEVLLQALIRWGADALPKLTGMFAFAFLDRADSRVMFARDPFGIKPFFYSDESRGIAFASEIKSLLEFPTVSDELDPHYLYNYLRHSRSSAGSATPFSSIQSLPGGHLGTVDLKTGDLSVSRYYTLSPKPREGLRFKKAAAELREQFLESVRLHLRSDVPVGSCLSGGIDSSAIVMAARHLEGPKADLHTFSYISNDSALSEEKWIDIVNKASGATPHKIRPTHRDLVNDLDRLIRIQDEPFAGTSIYAQYRVFQEAHAAGIKVMLDGQGADELLGGYQGASRRARLSSLLRAGSPLDVTRFILGLAWNCPDTPIIDVTAAAWAHANWPTPATENLVERGPDWMDTEWFTEHGVANTTYADPQDQTALHGYLISAATRSSMPALLRYEDRNSMAFSIESRVPFVTPAFAEFSLSMPEEFLVDKNGVSKALFREAMRGIVPDQVLDRKDKIGFTTPMAAWLTEISEWVEQILQSDVIHTQIGLNPEVVQRHWAQVRRGQRPFSQHMWRWINLVRWVENFRNPDNGVSSAGREAIPAGA